MLNNPIKYLLILFSALFIFSFGLYFGGFLDNNIFNSVIASLVLNFINSFIAFQLFNISFKKSNANYLIANLGGMGIRVLFILLSVIVVIKFLNIEKIAFILLFFIFYFLLLIIEVVFFMKKIEEKKISDNK